MARLTKLRSVLRRSKYLFLIATICFGCFMTLSITTGRDIWLLDSDFNIRKRRFKHQDYEIQSEEWYTIKTKGCSIPGLIPFDDAVKMFKQPPIMLKSCPNAKYSLLLSNETHIWIDTKMLSYYYLFLNKGTFSCCYKAFYRVYRPTTFKNVFSKQVRDMTKYSDCVHFTNYIKVAHEFVKVTCFSKGKPVYKQYFLYARITAKKLKPKNKPYYNVIIMGIDAISRLNFYRTMPKTLTFLKNKGAIELLGYNKVGDNTFPNVVPMLLGLKDTDLKKTCMSNLRVSFDHCPFIWQGFKKAGFHTAFGEDSASLSTFHFGRYGFDQAPTDYYLHTFIHEAEKHTGNMKDYSSLICMGNKYFYKVLLDYIEHLTSTLSSSKLFGFFWEVTMSHDFLNYPMAMDGSYESFLKNLDTSNKLNNTVLILLSDHGIRWGPIRLTKQGRLEERLPLVHILLPPSFQSDYNQAYNNLKQNSKRLTTPYDIHATLYDLIDLHAISNQSIERRSESTYALDRSISLFLPVPDNRTCKMADIDDHWCTCHKTVYLNPTSPMAKTMAEQLVIYLNKLLKNHPVCAKLSLSEVIEFAEMVAGTPSKHELGWYEYMAVIRTSPGSGVFEATMRHRWDKWSISGSVSRLNLYGHQSGCIHEYQLKLYCYCR